MCVVFMLSSPHQINWLRVDEDVPPHAVVTGSDLYIENLNKSYNGTYRCVASNAVGEAYDDYILYVYGRYCASVALAVRGLYWSYKDLLQNLCNKQNPISNVNGCKLLLEGAGGLKPQKVAAVDKSIALNFGLGFEPPLYY